MHPTRIRTTSWRTLRIWQGNKLCTVRPVHWHMHVLSDSFIFYSFKFNFQFLLMAIKNLFFKKIRKINILLSVKISFAVWNRQTVIFLVTMWTNSQIENLWGPTLLIGRCLGYVFSFLLNVYGIKKFDISTAIYIITMYFKK